MLARTLALLLVSLALVGGCGEDVRQHGEIEIAGQCGEVTWIYSAVEDERLPTWSLCDPERVVLTQDGERCLRDGQPRDCLTSSECRRQHPRCDLDGDGYPG